MNQPREIFDPMAHLIVKLVAQERLDEVDGVALLSTLIDHVRGTADQWLDSRHEFRNIGFVQDAFDAQGLIPDA